MCISRCLAKWSFLFLFLYPAHWEQCALCYRYLVTVGQCILPSTSQERSIFWVTKAFFLSSLWPGAGDQTKSFVSDRKVFYTEPHPYPWLHCFRAVILAESWTSHWRQNSKQKPAQHGSGLWEDLESRGRENTFQLLVRHPARGRATLHTSFWLRRHTRFLLFTGKKVNIPVASTSKLSCFS